MKKNETSCSACEAGSYCPGGTYSYNEDENQGINKCSAGTYSIGSASSCTSCAEGSYSEAGSSVCTACQNGKTTSGIGQSSCNANCNNASNVSTWENSTWNSDNTMSNLCSIASCNPCYKLVSNACSSQSTLYVSNSGNDSNGGYDSTIPFKTIQKAYNCPGNVTIKLTSNITPTSQTNFGQTKTATITSDGGPYTIYRGFSSGDILNVSAGTVNTSNVIFNGNGVSANGHLVKAYNGAIINLNSGTILEGNINNNNYDGSGAVASGSGTYLNINGAIIRNNRGTAGAGVLISSSATGILRSGVVSGNSQIGFEVWAANAYIQGGEISGNSAEAGGGMWISNDDGNCSSTYVEISGGQIKNNTANNSSTGGGGILIVKGPSCSPVTLDIIGGSISGNSAYRGGGIYCGEGATINFSSGSITGNTARNTGGGLWKKSNCTYNNGRGTISGNSPNNTANG